MFIAYNLDSIPVIERCFWEPAVSVMAMSLDSHVVNRSSLPGPGGLKLTPGTCACVPKILRGEWRRRDCNVAIPPGGVISRFLSLCLCLSGERTRPIARTSPKKGKKIKKKEKIKLNYTVPIKQFVFTTI